MEYIINNFYDLHKLLNNFCEVFNVISIIVSIIFWAAQQYQIHTYYCDFLHLFCLITEANLACIIVVSFLIGQLGKNLCTQATVEYDLLSSDKLGFIRSEAMSIKTNYFCTMLKTLNAWEI